LRRLAALLLTRPAPRGCRAPGRNLGRVDAELLIVGCGPAGGTAAREAARAGIATIVLERDPVVGAKRVCAAGLRPGFLDDFDLPRSIVHCDPGTISLSTETQTYQFAVGPSQTTTREELDGTIAALARTEGAEIRTHALFRALRRERDAVVVEYVDLGTRERTELRARSVFLASGASAQLDPVDAAFAHERWRADLLTCIQHRVFLERPLADAVYDTLEMHYYRSPFSGETIIAWVFPKRDHLSVGLGLGPKVDAAALRAELAWFLPRVRARLFPGVGYTLRDEGSLLYGGAPRPTIARDCVMVGGTAAGLVDATTGEGIYEAAVSGRHAADAAAAVRRGAADAAPHYERATKQAFFARLRHRHRLMTFLERKPTRFDVLFRQLEATPRFAELLQHDRNDFTPLQWLYLYVQAARFSISAAFA
jgi:digeranylgeranylglycerophospholipid reductase